MSRYVVAGLASLALTGCFPFGSCPDEADPMPLESGVYEAYQSDMFPDVAAQLGGVDGAMQVTVDRVLEEVHVDYVTEDGEARSLSFRITRLDQTF